MDLERHRVTGAKRIGYLAGDFPQGDVPTGFVEKLKQIEENFSQDVWSLGHHTCEYCFPGGDSELRKAIESDKISREEAQQATSSEEHCFGDYVWPDMLAHYITVHQYLPPNEFIDYIADFLIGECPQMQ